MNADFERIGTDSDTDIILSFIDRGYAVAVVGDDARLTKSGFEGIARHYKNY